MGEAQAPEQVQGGQSNHVLCVPAAVVQRHFPWGLLGRVYTRDGESFSTFSD